MIRVLQVGDLERSAIFVSLAPGMDQPRDIDPLICNVAQCYAYVSDDSHNIEQIAPNLEADD